MGVERIFFRGAHWGIFPKFFHRGTKSGEICFFPLKTKKITFLLKISKSKGGQGPLPPFPTHMATVQYKFPKVEVSLSFTFHPHIIGVYF